MRIHYLQHVYFEDLGCIEEWALEKEYQITSTKFFENSNLPRLEDFDFLIVMGGPMSIYDYDKYIWLKEEKEFIRSTINGGKKVLGICLGAQLIANVLGAKVYPNTQKEIGWFPIQKVINEKDILIDFPKNFEVFHWHGDTFDIPQNAVNLFSSEACRNQGFLNGSNVLALQFHLEVTKKSLLLMIENGISELKDKKYIQTKETILSDSNYIHENNKRMYMLLHNFILY